MGRGILVYADVPNRLVGILLDAIFLSALVFLGAVSLSLFFGPVVRFDLETYAATVDTRLAFANALLSLVLGGGYFVLSYLVLQASPGHRLLAMSLRPAEEAERITLASALLRWLLLAAPFGVASAAAVLVSGAADALLMVAAAAWYSVLLVTTARHPAKQGLHDRAARTVMVKAATVLGTPGDTAEE